MKLYDERLISPSLFFFPSCYFYSSDYITITLPNVPATSCRYLFSQFALFPFLRLQTLIKFVIGWNLYRMQIYLFLSFSNKYGFPYYSCLRVYERVYDQRPREHMSCEARERLKQPGLRPMKAKVYEPCWFCHCFGTRCFYTRTRRKRLRYAVKVRINFLF